MSVNLFVISLEDIVSRKFNLERRQTRYTEKVTRIGTAPRIFLVKEFQQKEKKGVPTLLKPS